MAERDEVARLEEAVAERLSRRPGNLRVVIQPGDVYALVAILIKVFGALSFGKELINPVGVGVQYAFC